MNIKVKTGRRFQMHGYRDILFRRLKEYIFLNGIDWK